MKKTLLFFTMALALGAKAQFSTGTVNLPTAGMTVKLDTNSTTVTLTLTGDSNSMFGIGFGNVGMEPGSDGYIYNSSASRDYTFAGTTVPNADPTQDWTEVSNTVAGATRTIVATRSLSGGNGDFAINNAAGPINIFYARRAGNQALGYHGASRDYATLNLSGTLATGESAAKEDEVVLYPNPATDKIYFKNADKIQSVDIYEATGRKVKSVKSNGDNISVSDLKQGNYYLEIKLKDGTSAYEKLIKK